MTQCICGHEENFHGVHLLHRTSKCFSPDCRCQSFLPEAQHRVQIEKETRMSDEAMDALDEERYANEQAELKARIESEETL